MEKVVIVVAIRVRHVQCSGQDDEGEGIKVLFPLCTSVIMCFLVSINVVKIQTLKGVSIISGM